MFFFACPALTRRFWAATSVVDSASRSAWRTARKPEAVVPKDLREVAPAPPENVEIASVRIAHQLLLNLKRQSLHAATHVGVVRRDPHPHPARHRDHRSLRTFRTRRSASASTSLSTRTRLPRSEER